MAANSSVTVSSNCSADVQYGPQGREGGLLLQQIAFIVHGTLVTLAIAGFHIFAERSKKKGHIMERRNPTILALRLGRELLENTLMWAAMLNIANITRADYGLNIAICAVGAVVVGVHVQAVLAFREKVILIDEAVESYDVALCFHFNAVRSTQRRNRQPIATTVAHTVAGR